MPRLLSSKHVSTIIRTLLLLKLDKVGRPLFFAFRSSLSKYRKLKRFTVTIDGVDIVFSTDDPYSNAWFFPRYLDGKVHEEPVTRLLSETLKSAKLFVDVGTNLGWYTCLAAKLMPNGSVVGFEMDNLSLTLVRKNLHINNCTNVRLVHAAVTDHLGTVRYERLSTYPRPDLHISRTSNNKRRDKSVLVDAVSLDGFFARYSSFPDVIKIDVEGAEMSVLRGMENLFREQSFYLFIEIHPASLPLFQSTSEEVLAFLMSRGYEVFEIQHMRSDRQRIHLKKLERTTYLRHNTMLYARK